MRYSGALFLFLVCTACGPLRRTPISVGPAEKQGINPPAFTPRGVDANSHLCTPTRGKTIGYGSVARYLINDF